MIGTLRNTLNDHGLNENTILIFTSDHGLQYGEFGLGGKALCYDTCLRVPLLIYDPRQAGGERLPHLVQSIDIAPTLLHLAGLTPPNTMQGESLLPLIQKQNVVWRQVAFGENLWSNQHGNPRCETVRTDQYRYIRYFQNDRLEKIHATNQSLAKAYATSLTASIHGEPIVYEELYHTAIDPYEATNLIHKKIMPKSLTTSASNVPNSYVLRKEAFISLLTPSHSIRLNRNDCPAFPTRSHPTHHLSRRE